MSNEVTIDEITAALRAANVEHTVHNPGTEAATVRIVRHTGDMLCAGPNHALPGETPEGVDYAVYGVDVDGELGEIQLQDWVETVGDLVAGVREWLARG